MCGIAGIFGNARTRVPIGDVARAMASAISYRGPDSSGVWADPESSIALGHRRLSIVDLSPAGHQPMQSADARFVLVFNGEIYNHVSIRAELERQERSPGWRGRSDTETMLAAISAWGLKEALHRFTGMFAFALYDRRDHTLTLVRDRLGEKPLYYGWIAGGALIFGSELAALEQHPDFRGEIDRDALALLLRHNCIPAPYSIYKEIGKLPPGTFLTVAPGARGATPVSYWSAADAATRGAENPFQGSASEAAGCVEALMRQSVAGQMLADVPLGAFLSGGVDSSAVVAMMQSQSARPVKTFSIGFREAGYDEAPFAREVARHLGTDHTEFYCTTRDALDIVPKLAGAYCEPFADSSQIPALLIAALARQHVKVALTGDGGDELFAGYTRYALAQRLWPTLSKFPQGLRRGAAGALRSVTPAGWDAIAGGAMRVLPLRYKLGRSGDKLHKAAGILTQDSFEDLYRELVSHWPDPAAVVLGSREPPTVLTGLHKPPKLASRMQDMMHLDMVSYLPDDILVKVDRAAMSVSLETRVPLLDHRLVEFAMSLSADVLRAGKLSKWPLRQMLYKHVPKALIERPKMGFGVPLDSWLRGPLRDWAEALLDEARLQREGYFKADVVRAAWREHLSGRRNFQYRLWDVLMFQAWNEARVGAGLHI